MEFNIQKRVEKVSQAIYLASNHIKDNEPLKWEIRRESLACLACSKSISQSEEIQEVPVEVAIQSFSSSVDDLISLLSIASISGIISTKNSQIIIREIELINTILKQQMGEQAAKAGLVLSEEFFRQLDKGQNLNLMSPTNKSTVHKRQENQTEPIKDKKDTRIGRIMAVLKDHPQSTIKDFSSIITDCSEKTIQRELIDLVEKGIVKKDGERRWSKYSLK